VQFWFTEEQSKGLRISVQVERVVEKRRTPYQEAVVSETSDFGRMLTLDDVIQTTERDEFAYHEMICHVPMCSHPNPDRVLVVGGGDGGAVREVLKHPVQAVDLVEIDEAVISLSKEHLPSISSGLADPRVRVIIGDGIEFVAGSRDAYDVIIVDSTDPVGPAQGLFERGFFERVRRALREGGLFAAQTGSPFYSAELVARVYRDLRSVFPKAGLYLGCVPTYPGGLWVFSIGSVGGEFTSPLPGRVVKGTKYYDEAVHSAAFVLPPFVRRLIDGDR
jgi:spermidine synthase